MDDPRITSEAHNEPTLRRDDDDERDSRPRRRPDYQKDREHLNVLSICYFVTCGFQCIGLLVGMGYLAFGMAIVGRALGTGRNTPPPVLGFVMIAVGVVGLLWVGAFTTCLGLTGNFLRQRKYRTFCFVIACILCPNVPLGTILGVFTILVLNRPSVQELFRSGDQPTGEGDPLANDED